MKFNIILKFLLVASIFLFSSYSSRTLSHIKSHFKFKHSLSKTKAGSWESGYICKRLRVWKGVKERGNDSVIANIRFTPRQIDVPQNEIEQSGIFFSFENDKPPYGYILNILEAHPTIPNTFILPYKNIYEDFYQERVGMWRVLGMGGGRHTVFYAIIRDKVKPEKLYKFKLSLPYEGNDVLIPEDEIGRILFRIQENKKNVLKYFEVLKGNAIVASAGLIRDREIANNLEA